MLVAVEGWKGDWLGIRVQQAVKGVVMSLAAVEEFPATTNTSIANTAPLVIFRSKPIFCSKPYTSIANTLLLVIFLSKLYQVTAPNTDAMTIDQPLAS